MMEADAKKPAAVSTMLKTRKGQGLTEYMLILALISTVAILLMSAFGMQVAQLVQVVIDSF